MATKPTPKPGRKAAPKAGSTAARARKLAGEALVSPDPAPAKSEAGQSNAAQPKLTKPKTAKASATRAKPGAPQKPRADAADRIAAKPATPRPAHISGGTDSPPAPKSRAPKTAKAGPAQPKPSKPEPAKPQAAKPKPGKPKPTKPASLRPFNIVIVAQAGRLAYEALIFTASLRAHAPGFAGRLIVAEVQPQDRWHGHDTLIPAPIRNRLTAMGAQVQPLVCRHFGAAYPHGNKIEALSLLPPGEPFVFFDTDTVITGPLDRVAFDFARPAASMRREGTWPQPPLYGPGYAGIWKSLYDRFGLDFDSSLDLTQPDEHWERYLYFNAGWFFGADPVLFAQRLADWARAIRDDPGDALAAQELFPWLDQITLPLVIHSLGGGRPGPELDGLDGDVSCHYRKLPLLYATAPDASIDALESAVAPNPVKKLLRDWDPAKKLIYQGKGRDKIRPLFAGAPLPLREAAIRKRIKAAGWWLA